MRKSKNLSTFNAICRIILVVFYIVLINFYLRWFWADSHMKKAAICSLDQKWNQVLEHYQAALQLKPYYVLAHCFMGSAYRKRNQNLDNLFNALDKYQGVIKMFPYYLQSKYQKAVTIYTQALRIKPDYARGYSKLAKIYLGMNDISNAKQVLNKVLILNPENEKYKSLLC